MSCLYALFKRTEEEPCSLCTAAALRCRHGVTRVYYAVCRPIMARTRKKLERFWAASHDDGFEHAAERTDGSTLTRPQHPAISPSATRISGENCAIGEGRDSVTSGGLNVDISVDTWRCGTNRGSRFLRACHYRFWISSGARSCRYKTLCAALRNRLEGAWRTARV